MFLVRKYSIYILLRNTLAMFTRSCVDTNSNKFNKKTPVFSYFVDTKQSWKLDKSHCYMFLSTFTEICALVQILLYFLYNEAIIQ